MTSALRRLRTPNVSLPTALAILLLIAVETALGMATTNMTSLRMVLAGLAGVVLIGFTLLRPSVTVYAFIFLVYTRVSDPFTGGGLFTLNNGLLLLFAGAIVLQKVLVRREGLVWDGLLALALAYGGVSILSIIGLADKGSGPNAVAAHVRDLLFMLVIINLVTTMRGVRISTWALMAGGSFLALPALLSMVTGRYFWGLGASISGQIVGSVDGSRITGSLGDPNYFAQILAVIVPLALYRVWGEKNWLFKLAALGTLAALSLAIIMTFSRGGILALGVVFLLALLMRRVGPAQLAAIALVIALLVYMAPATLGERLGTLTDFFEEKGQSTSTVDSSLLERSRLVQVGWQMFLANPILGVGKGTYLENYQNFAWRVSTSLTTNPMVAHSSPIQIAAETGLLGLGVYAAILFVAIRALRRAKHQLKRWNRPDDVLLVEAIELGIYAYLVTSLFLSDVYPTTLWLMIALAVAVRQIMNRSEPATAPALNEAL